MTEKRPRRLKLGDDDRTTGDPKLDAVIERYINDRQDRPCDYRKDRQTTRHV